MRETIIIMLLWTVVFIYSTFLMFEWYESAPLVAFPFVLAAFLLPFFGGKK